MSRDESMQLANEVGTQTSVPSASSQISPGTPTSEKRLQSMDRREASNLPEAALTDSPAKEDITPGDTDHSFVREEPW
jgi:hypothetical protein